MPQDIFDFISINPNSRIPKYKQIVDSIITNISTGRLEVDDKIPSINALSEEYYLSRDTVEKAYNILKKKQIITSIRGKGYYITRTPLVSKLNVLFLVNKLSSYKMRIYNSFVNASGTDTHVDLYIYHCSETLFLNLLNKNKGAYDYIVVMPHFKTKDLSHNSYTEKVIDALKQIPKDKLVILDNNKMVPEISDKVVYQDFEEDLYQALSAGLSKISKYKTFILAYPQDSLYPYPKRILHGFRKFCANNHIEFEVINEIYPDMILKKGDLYLIIDEEDLVSIVQQIRESEFEMGKGIGVICYNDTPLKELLGITVVSTDFKEMGKSAAQLIKEKRKAIVKNPFNFIDRKSM